MITIKVTLLASIGLLSMYASKAQTFKEPIAYQLKNGMNILISENSRSPKAYSSFTLDASAFETKKDAVVELLNGVLNASAAEHANISFNDNSGKLATAPANLIQDLSAMANIIQHAVLDQSSFDKAKNKLLLSLKEQDYNYDQTVNEHSVNALTLTDVTLFYNQISPEKTYLTIAGNVQTKTAKIAVKKAFGEWDKTLGEARLLTSNQ